MSLSQLSGKQGINYAKLRHKKNPNELQLNGISEEMSRENLHYIETLILKKNAEPKHKRAKSTLQQQNSYRNVTPILDEVDGDKLFDQFFKLNNSKSDSDFMKDSVQKERKSYQNEFLQFVSNAIEYHKQSDIKYFKPVSNKSNIEQQLKEAMLSNRLLTNEIKKYKQKEIELKNKLKMIQKEYTYSYNSLHRKCQYLEELLAKQKIDNENSLLAVKKTVEMLQIKCKCQKGGQLCDKILKDVRNQQKSRQQYNWYESQKQSHSSSEISHTTQERDEDQQEYPYYENQRRKSNSKLSDEQQSLIQSYINQKIKNTPDLFQRKRQLQDPYFIEEENTINSS